MFGTGCAGGTVCLSRSHEGETLCWRWTACDSQLWQCCDGHYFLYDYDIVENASTNFCFLSWLSDEVFLIFRTMCVCVGVGGYVFGSNIPVCFCWCGFKAYSAQATFVTRKLFTFGLFPVIFLHFAIAGDCQILLQYPSTVGSSVLVPEMGFEPTTCYHWSSKVLYIWAFCVAPTVHCLHLCIMCMFLFGVQSGQIN